MRPKKKRLKKSAIAVQFWDHCTGSDPHLKPIMCEVIGIVLYEDDLYIRIASWVCNAEVDNPNNELFVVLKSCIIRRKRLR
jgi:hypothetical protein